MQIRGTERDREFTQHEHGSTSPQRSAEIRRRIGVRDGDDGGYTDMWNVCRLEIGKVRRIEPELFTPISLTSSPQSDWNAENRPTGRDG